MMSFPKPVLIGPGLSVVLLLSSLQGCSSRPTERLCRLPIAGPNRRVWYCPVTGCTLASCRVLLLAVASSAGERSGLGAGAKSAVALC
ncbi:uncharacterized protein P884DRAFT_53434 [Thermothelomyces heterothallicus CBS 202.75]|uniref:uncharacterized protein n=1 Tax=Thermothelomyces heterothallicus CBS 202.75 TaxID=1149848 RepID=UPI003743069B